MSEREELPEGWAWATLGEVAEIVSGGTPDASDESNFEDGDIPWITPADLTGYREPVIRRGRRNLTRKGLESSSARLMPAGTVLFSSRAPIGYCVIADGELATNQGFKNLLLRGGIEPTFIRHYLLSAKEYISSLASGTTFPELSGARMREISVPIPPLPEQRRIVARLETLQARARKAREALEAIPAMLERYRQSVLAAAFRGDLTADWRERNPDAEPASALLERIRAERRRLWEEKYPRKKYVEPEGVDAEGLPELPEGWCWATLETLCRPDKPISYGILKPGPFEPEGIPMLRIGDVVSGAVSLEDVHRVSTDLSRQYDRTVLEGGEVVISLVGTIGVVAVVPGECKGANIHRNLGVITPGPHTRADWLCFYFQSPCGKDSIRSVTTGASQPLLNLGDLRLLPVPVAPIREQIEIASQMMRHTERIITLAATFDESLAKGVSFDRSLLAQAFRGDLVPQDPADEPASALLDRLRAERAAAPAKKRRGK